jgi:hypothetical protein
LLSEFSELFQLAFAQRPPLSSLQITQLNGPDAHPDQLANWMTKLRSHSPDLSLAALSQHDT